jgi:ribulose kinase
MTIELRERHVPLTNAAGEPVECGYCAEDAWPCDAIRAADEWAMWRETARRITEMAEEQRARADKAEAALALAAYGFNSSVEYERAKVADMMRQRDAARTDAERLAEALRWAQDKLRDQWSVSDLAPGYAALKQHDEMTR